MVLILSRFFLCVCAPLFLLCLVAKFLSFCVFSDSYNSPGWLHTFFPQKVETKFVVSSLPINRTCFEWAPGLAELVLMDTLRSKHREPAAELGGGVGLTLGALGVPTHLVGRSPAWYPPGVLEWTSYWARLWHHLKFLSDSFPISFLPTVVELPP